MNPYRRLICLCLTAVVLITMAASCTVPQKYNSRDLAELPCELGSSVRFFTPLEFTDSGDFKFKDQVDAIEQRLANQEQLSPELRNHPEAVTDLVFFLHGWNKNAASAESDYQDLLCRLHSELRHHIWDRKRKGGLLVVGIFWRSTITNREQEPWLLKPFSYFQVRKRADHIARTGLSNLFKTMTPWMKSNARKYRKVRTHLIGHSFGGRMMITAMEQLNNERLLVDFLTASSRTNIALINPAVDRARFTWIAQEVKRITDESPGASARLTNSTNSFLFNLFSKNDSANRYLFRLASMFNSDETGCAVGACGVAGFPHIAVSESGRLESKTGNTEDSDINAWNIDTSRIVFDHSDIYKGRMANLLAELLYCFRNSDSRAGQTCVRP